MSKKTIVFKMPAASVADAEVSPPDHAPAPELWVQSRAAEANPPSDSRDRFVVDLARERDWTEVVALSFLVPPTLGWFWFVNAMERAWRAVAR